MQSSAEASGPRKLTSEELAVCIKLLREARQWSQEQLSDISNLSVRTVQRVEQGLSGSIDTRRALARAFDFEDIDALNKPFDIPTAEEAMAAKEKFDREHVTLKATPLTAGKQLARLAESCSMDMSEPSFEASREVAETFAALIDFFREYRDCQDLYTEVQKLDVHEDMQSYIDDLKHRGVSLVFAERQLVLKPTADDARSTPFNVAFILGFPIGRVPEQIVTPKAARIQL